VKPLLLLLAFALFGLSGFGSTHTAASHNLLGKQNPPAQGFARNVTIYVSDFELDAQDVKVDQGGIVGEVRPGILERPRKRREHDPQAQAEKFVDLMSQSIVNDLQKAGYKSERLATGVARPALGAWVHGVFTEVDEGNRVHRAIFGFGSGETKMTLFVSLTDLARPEKPLYDQSTSDTSGKKVGALITMNPYVAAAKFVMEKNAPEKTVKKTASEISANLVAQLQAHAIN
jgi:Domain of unknown function (DUF4410)